MTETWKVLSLLFDRPGEPLLCPKDDEVFDFPTTFVQDQYLRMMPSIRERFDIEHKHQITMKNISLPDLSVPMTLGKGDNFSLFIPNHQVAAASLVDIFMAARTVEDFISIAAYCHDRLNPYLFNYALSVAMLHRPDTKGIDFPSVMYTFPAKFVDSAVFYRARKEASLIPEEFRTPIIIDKYYTASALEPEQQVAYFREDIGISLHHWHWHLVYPFGLNDKSMVAKDRRGELFFYMHFQILARYNAERFCNNLQRVKSLSNLREPISEGYFPKLHSSLASRYWSPRFMNTSLNDIDRKSENILLTIEDVEQWISNIRSAIEDGFLVDSNGHNISLMDNNGIDILGNIIESTTLSPNRDLYGDLHNSGHLLISFCHDPTNRFLETYSIMGETATAMRDPVFYRWHNFINELFLYHKDKLPPYSLDKLTFKDVSITQVHISVFNNIPNQLHTFWEQSDVDLSRGLDFSPRGPVYVRFTHLQHKPFTYNIKVVNNSKERLGTVRIFLAPMFDENGAKMTFNEQRLFMIELDRFKVTLHQGTNEINRESVDSSVTIPYEKRFRNFDEKPVAGVKEIDNFNYCGCGWPHHMLIPKGTEKGCLFELFVMVSDYRADKVVQDMTGVSAGEVDADSYCGIQDKKYPDKQAMGFPFDRVARSGVSSLSSFLTANMRVLPITITFTDKQVLRAKEQLNYTVVKVPTE